MTTCWLLSELKVTTKVVPLATTTTSTMLTPPWPKPAGSVGGLSVMLVMGLATRIVSLTVRPLLPAVGVARTVMPGPACGAAPRVGAWNPAGSATAEP